MVRATISSPTARMGQPRARIGAKNLGLETVFQQGVIPRPRHQENLRGTNLARLLPQPTQGARPRFNLIGTRRMGEG